ncbi:unnamed protein product, partial [marine sediment metagenome]
IGISARGSRDLGENQELASLGVYSFNYLGGGGALAITVAADDHYEIRMSLRLADIDKWGGTELTGRDISLDLKALVDDSIKGILKSIGDAGEAANLLGRIGEVQASPTANTVLDRLKALAKLIPIAKAAIFNTALPAAEANWLGSDIEPTNSPSYLRIYACVSVTGILRVARTQDATTVTEDLNSGTDLIADAAYMFTVPWRTGDSINVKYSVTTGLD